MLFLNNILLIADKLASKQVPPWDVVLLLFYMLPSVIALATPFATLAGVLMAIGRFSSDNEIMAMQALGISFPRMFIPIFFLGLVFTTGSFLANDILMPLGTINFNKRLQDVVTQNPELELGSFTVKNFDENTTLAAGLVENKVIQDLVIFDRGPEQERRTILARQAYIEKKPGKEGILSIQLVDAVAMIPDTRIKKNFEYFTSDRMTYNFLLKSITSALRRPGATEMSALDVWKEIQKKEEALVLLKIESNNKIKSYQWELLQNLNWPRERMTTLSRQSFESTLVPAHQNFLNQKLHPVSDRLLIIEQMEFFQKFTIPLSCVLFALLAFPIGVFNKRSGRMLGFIVAIMISFIYWSMLLGVRNLSQMSSENPVFIMIAPNLVLLVFGGLFFYLRSKH